MRLLPHLLTLSLLAASPALARPPSVFINNVKVDGLTGQAFTGVDIVFDANGDIRITAKGYKIASMESAVAPITPPPAATTTSVDRHFYIATMQPAGRTGMAQWDIDVYVNQVFVKRFQSRDPEPIAEITRFLRPGTNVIHYTARKEEGERQSVSPADYFELVVGDGENRAGQVMINKLTAYRRTAAEIGLFNSEATLELPGAR